MKNKIVGTPLKMQYRVEDGLKVCKNGEVIIDGVRHLVQDGFVKCSRVMNCRAWNVTREKELCPVCYHQPRQLSFDF